MPKTKISEYSATNSSNTDIEGINIDEGCPPSSINNAIREVMVHLKEFQTGASGDAFTFAGGTLMSGTNTISGAAVISGNINSSGTTNTFSGGNILSGTNTISGSAIISGNINSSGTTNTFSGGNIFSGTNTFSGTNVFSSNVTLNAQSDLRFADSDSSNWVAFQSPATVASNVTWTLPATDGTSNQVLATNGSGTLSWATASSSQWTTSGSDISYTTGSVGIGSSTIRGTLNVSDGTLNTAGEGVYQGYIVGADRSALTEGNLTVQSNDAMAVDKGGSISFGGRAVSASSAGANWARIAGRKETGTSAEYGGYLQFSTRPNSGAATERARITSGGYLKVSNTGSYLGSTGAYHEIRSSDSGSAVCMTYSTNASFTAAVVDARAERNTTNNSFYAYAYYNGTPGSYTGRFFVADSGNVTNTNNSYGSISDVKLKQDIVDAGSQWNDIKGLRVRKYRWKSDPDGFMQMGLVAQEAELVSPGLIDEHFDRDEENNLTGETTKAVKYSVLYIKAVKALQEAMERIETLEAQNAAFEARLAALEAN